MSFPTPVRHAGKGRSRMLRKPEGSKKVTENESKLDSSIMENFNQKEKKNP